MKNDQINLDDLLVATYDIETDPFKHNRSPKPFCFGFFRGEQTKTIKTSGFMSDEDQAYLIERKDFDKERKNLEKNKYDALKRRQRKAEIKEEVTFEEMYFHHWDSDPKNCTQAFIDLLESLDHGHLIFAHNGGKFDYMFLHKFIRGAVFVINGRLTHWEYTNAKGITHVLRDSFPMIPTSLASGTGAKLDIDYRKMERNKREKHKEEILIYLKQDCVALFDLVNAFRDRFGKWFMTIASASFDLLKKYHPSKKSDEFFDNTFRPYYFGGRCQTFQSGKIEGDIFVIDVNSMYPYVMKNYDHPNSPNYYRSRIINKDTFFIRWKGKNFGAVPSRAEDGSVRFDLEYGEFLTTIHEYKVAIKYKLIEVEKIIETLNFRTYGNFSDFVNASYAEKENAQKGTNEYTIAKLIMNSPYGKFAQDSRKYKKYEFVDPSETVLDENIDVIESDEFKLLISPDDTEVKRFNNVATAASITGASRAELLEAGVLISKASCIPLYSDTDSFIGKGDYKKIKGLKFHESELGAWDLEKTGDCVYIGGKKIYALYDGENCLKIASKGVRVVPRDIYEFLPQKVEEHTTDRIKQTKQEMLNIGGNEIIKISMGEEFNFKNDAPSLKLDGRSIFVERTMRNTFKKTVTPIARN